MILGWVFGTFLPWRPANGAPPDSGLDFFQLQRVFQVPDNNLSTERSREIQGMWAYPENIHQRFDVLIYTGRDYSSAYFRRAVSMFEKSRGEDRRFQKKKREMDRLLNESNDPRPFSAREKRDAIRNSFAHESIRHHEKMAADYDSVLQLLDSGKAGPVEPEGPNRQLYLETLRLSIIHYSKARKYSEALWRLRRYFQMHENASLEWPFHFYVAISLSHLYRAGQDSQPADEIFRLQSLKDRYILNYLELRYGRDSYQYTEMFQKLRREAGPLHFLRKEQPIRP